MYIRTKQNGKILIEEEVEHEFFQTEQCLNLERSNAWT